MSIREERANIKSLEIGELDEHVLVLLKEQFKLRMQYKGGQSIDSSRFRKVRRSIARAKTFRNLIRIGKI